MSHGKATTTKPDPGVTMELLAGAGGLPRTRVQWRLTLHNGTFCTPEIINEIHDALERYEAIRTAYLQGKIPGPDPMRHVKKAMGEVNGTVDRHIIRAGGATVHWVAE